MTYLKDLKQIKTITQLREYIKKHENGYIPSSHGNCNYGDKEPKIDLSYYTEAVCLRSILMTESLFKTAAYALDGYLIYHSSRSLYLWEFGNFLKYAVKFIAVYNLQDIIINMATVPLLLLEPTTNKIHYDELRNLTIAKDYIEQNPHEGLFICAVNCPGYDFKEKKDPNYFMHGYPIGKCSVDTTPNSSKSYYVAIMAFIERHNDKDYHICKYVDNFLESSTSIKDYNIFISKANFYLFLRNYNQPCIEGKELNIGTTSIIKSKTFEIMEFNVCKALTQGQLYVEQPYGLYHSDSGLNCYHHATDHFDISREDDHYFLCQHSPLSFRGFQAQVIYDLETAQRYLKNHDGALISENKYCSEIENYTWTVSWFVDFNEMGYGANLVDYWVCADNTLYRN